MRLTLSLLLMLSAANAGASDLFEANREMVKRGVQAMLTCNGLFTSHRTLEEVFNRELAYMGPHIGSPHGGDYRIHEDLRAVEIGTPDNPPVMRAAFRKGIGCVAMAPGQSLDEIDDLPEIDIPAPARNPATEPWPDGERPTMHGIS